MGTIKRILLVLVAFVVVNAALFVILRSLGVERGGWQYALAIGVGIAIVNGVWRRTALKDQPPP
jgi:hypothetical protein